MRSLRIPSAMAAMFMVAVVPGCGLGSQGLLATDGGGVAMTTEPGADAGGGSDDSDATATPAADDEAGISSDAATGSPPDGSTPAGEDSGAAKDAALDVASLTCTGCVDQMCPTQVAACGPGSDCLAYRDCSVGCALMGDSTCSKACASKDSAGEAAYGALTLCAFGCGAGCAAGLTVGAP
jgi:hypothetical protein